MLMVKNQFAERFLMFIAPPVVGVFEQTKFALIPYPLLHVAHLKSLKGALKTSQFTSGFGV
jgi:hypothetical protein